MLNFKNKITLFLLFILIGCKEHPKTNLCFTIDKSVNQQDDIVLEIIPVLNSFLETKNQSFEINDYWLKSDFDKYEYPFLDIYQIENDIEENNVCQPILKEISTTDVPNKWIVKLAFVKTNIETKENETRVIYNIIANKIDNKIVFSKYQDYALKNWKQFQIDNILYFISPKKEINYSEVKQQQNDILRLCEFFNSKPFPLTYISCVDPIEVFQVKGFDFNPMMFVSKVGGLVEGKDVILSGNNSEVYSHEMVHIFTQNLFQNTNQFLDEGLATYLSGSGLYDYKWHKEKFKKFIKQNPNFQVENHMSDLYERLYFEEETSIPYLIAAIVCERTIRIYGKEKYFEILKSSDDLWISLEKVGLNLNNMNEEIRNELEIL